MTDVHASWEYDHLFSTHEKCGSAGVPSSIIDDPAVFQMIDDPIPVHHMQQQHQPMQWTQQVHHTPSHDSLHSPSHGSSSHCSSPWTGSVEASGEPVWLEEDLHSGEHSESEATARTTPIMQQERGVPMQQPLYHQHMIMAMPTIVEQVMPQPADGIGMLPTNMDQDVHMTASRAPVHMQQQQQVPSSGASAASSVRSKRRTRYTTAAAASVAARASVGHRSHSSSGSPPMLEHASSRDSSRNMDVTSTGSAHSSEQEEEDADVSVDRNAHEEFDEEYDEEVSPGKHSKRKRTTGKSSSNQSQQSGSGDENFPGMKGLDKRERNKLSASMYRKRRKVYLDSLEGKVGELDATIAKQSETIARQQHENKMLKEQLSFLKKMLPKSLGSSDDSPAQPSNNHPGASSGPRRTLGQSAGAFLFLVLAVCVLFNPMTDEDGTSSLAPMGRRAGRTLLSVDEAAVSVESDLGTVASNYAGEQVPSFNTESNNVHVEYESLTSKALGFDFATASPMRTVEFSFEVVKAGFSTVVSAVGSSLSAIRTVLLGGTGSTNGGIFHASN